MAKRVILDVDTGLDDAIAVMLAVLSPELEVTAITTVSGNVHVNLTSVNTLKVLEVIGVNVPVAKGMSKPLVKELVTAEAVHGSDGLGDIGLPPPKGGLEKRHAVDLIIEEVKEHPKDTWIITTGPQTNLAMVLLKEPELVDDLCGVISMGGAFFVTPYGHGNVTPVAEYNIWCDPEAAKVVLSSGLEPTYVGLDVTMNPSAALTRREAESILASRSNPSAKLLARLSLAYMNRLKYDRMWMHDPLAVAYAIDGSVLKVDKYPMYIDVREGLTRGITIIDRRKAKVTYAGGEHGHAYVAVDVDGEKFLALLRELIVDSRC